MKQLTTYKIDARNEVAVGYANAERCIVLMHGTDGSPRNYTDRPIRIAMSISDPVALGLMIKTAGYAVPCEPQALEQVDGATVGFAKDPDGHTLEFLPLRKPAATSPATPAAT